MARYDRYDRWRQPPPTFSGWYPGAFWAGAPMYGWDGMAGWPPYLGADPYGTPPNQPRRRSPYDGPFDRGPRYDAPYAGPRRSQLGPRERMRYDRDHYDPRGARRYDERYERVWDRWW